MSLAISSFFSIPDSQENRRIVLAVLIAAAFHTLLILGVSFATFQAKNNPAVLSLNVTLQEKPGDEPTPGVSTEPGPPQPAKPAPPQPPTPPAPRKPAPPPVHAPAPAKPTTQPVVSPTPAKPAAPKQGVPKPQRAPAPSAPAAAPPAPAPQLSGTDLLNLGLQMARQESTDPQTLRSREKQLDSKSMTTLEKFYQESWVRKVEQVGNLNFPEEARRNDLTKGPVLAVAIRADGTIKHIRILQSSGHPPLDQAATQIVRLAAPYSPFPPELRRQYDVLTIVRRWEFKHGRLSGR